MKKLFSPLIAILFFASCGTESMTDIQPDQEIGNELLTNNSDSDLLNANMRIVSGSCEGDCIEPGSEIYYPVSDMTSLTVGKNTKSVSYYAYNTETDFVVDVTYAITSGPPNAKAAITINIDGNELVYEDVNSGNTVSHTVPLAEGWAGCDQVAFSIVQEALGEPITFSESYNLIPLCEEEGLKIGDEYEGGIIAYILQPGDPGYVENETHGIIAAPSDQNAGIVIQWNDGTIITTGATGTALGTGLGNTNLIVTAQGAGSYAAQLCADLVLNSYSDWYLPSKDELNKLYINRVAIGGFATSDFAFGYWSSSEFNDITAFSQSFFFGNQGGVRKDGSDRVRAVRSF